MITSFLNNISLFNGPATAGTETGLPPEIGVPLGIVFILLSFWAAYMCYVAWRDVQDKKRYSNYYDKDKYSWWERNRYPFWMMMSALGLMGGISFITGTLISAL